MIKQPLFIEQFILIIIIGIFHHIALQFYLYWVFPWFDMLMHFLGGLWVGLVGIWYVYFSGIIKNINIKSARQMRIFSISIITVVIIGVLWEIFEVYSGVLSIEENYWFDTSLDILMDTSGASAAFLYIRHKYNDYHKLDER